MRQTHNYGVRELRNYVSAQMQASFHAVVVEAPTALTNVRRIQTLRRLTKGEAVTLWTLTEEPRMSAPALGRHTEKLTTEGHAESGSVGRCLCHRLAPGFKTPIHGKMFEIVRARWGGK